MSAVQPAFDGLAHVGEKMPTVGNLYGPGSTEAGATGVLGRAVLGHDFDVRSLNVRIPTKPDSDSDLKPDAVPT